ncbi:hypothetical protein [Acinetobacter sp. Ac_5812]|uniref:DUF6904 family protein n=1 Tax=Acinetobacter sp. Ac_5812 TaxID=1848937 RepID=UPI00148FE4D2|nr:hypothetical protein [Acinetobacter sp. Ac_5812]NNP70419.1 hypothetical protein [Acinetobacter sp. Ac_5812]
MLTVTLTPFSLGAKISGTEDDLIELYEAISDILPDDEDWDDVLLVFGLKYDLRKAWSGKRHIETISLPIIENSSVHLPQKIYSVDVLLPMLFCQIHILFSYIEHFYIKYEKSLRLIEHLNQELIYKIEEKSVDAALFYINWSENNAPFSRDYHFAHIDLITSEYIKLSGERVHHILDILKDLTESSESYCATAKLIEEAATTLSCDPSDVIFDEPLETYEQLDQGQYLW